MSASIHHQNSQEKPIAIQFYQRYPWPVPRTLRLVLFASILSLLLAIPASAQYRMVAAPENHGDPGLRDISVGFVIPELIRGEGASWAG